MDRDVIHLVVALVILGVHPRREPLVSLRQLRQDLGGNTQLPGERITGADALVHLLHDAVLAADDHIADCPAVFSSVKGSHRSPPILRNQV